MFFRVCVFTGKIYVMGGASVLPEQSFLGGQDTAVYRTAALH